MHFTTSSDYEMISDTCIINNLGLLQDKYNFEVVSIKSTGDFSKRIKIIIKCSKEESVKVFYELISNLGSTIEDIVYD